MSFTIPNELAAPDAFVFREASGWYELGLAQESMNALGTLTLEGSWHQDVMQLRVNILKRSGNLDLAFDVAYELTDAHADRAESWLSLAALYRDAGQKAAALQCLVDVENRFSSNREFVLELARCACDCGQIEAAREWLSLALSVGNRDSRRTTKLAALEDPRLAVIWSDEPG